MTISELRTSAADQSLQTTLAKAVSLTGHGVALFEQLGALPPGESRDATIEAILHEQIMRHMPLECSSTNQSSKNSAFYELANSLGVEATDAQRIHFANLFLAKASDLPEGSAASIGAWYSLAVEMLMQLTGGKPARNEVLRRLAPGREKRKLSKSGKPYNADGEIQTRIFEVLKTQSKKLWPKEVRPD